MRFKAQNTFSDRFIILTDNGLVTAYNDYLKAYLTQHNKKIIKKLKGDNKNMITNTRQQELALTKKDINFLETTANIFTFLIHQATETDINNLFVYQYNNITDKKYHILYIDNAFLKFTINDGKIFKLDILRRTIY